MSRVSTLRVEAAAPEYAPTDTEAVAVEAGSCGRSAALARGQRFNWGFALTLGLCAGFWALVVGMVTT